MEGYREAMDGGVEGPSHAPNAVSSVGGVMQPLYACLRRDLNELRTPSDIACENQGLKDGSVIIVEWDAICVERQSIFCI